MLFICLQNAFEYHVPLASALSDVLTRIYRPKSDFRHWGFEPETYGLVDQFSIHQAMLNHNSVCLLIILHPTRACTIYRPLTRYFSWLSIADLSTFFPRLSGIPLSQHYSLLTSAHVYSIKFFLISSLYRPWYMRKWKKTLNFKVKFQEKLP